jgi:enoyl-CoA hydratase/carnithine racemase
MPEYADLLYEVEDGIATITLNRPDRLNAISPPMLRSFSEAFREADLDSGVRVSSSPAPAAASAPAWT